jgi:hypothetical protein
MTIVIRSMDQGHVYARGEVVSRTRGMVLERDE